MSCPGARIVPFPDDSFTQLLFDSLPDALRASVPHRRYRIISGWSMAEWDSVSITSDAGDDAAAWQCSVTDGAGVFESFSGDGRSVNLPAGDYGVTCDVATAPNSRRTPTFDLRATMPAYLSCPERAPLPPCGAQFVQEPWGEFGDAIVRSAYATLKVASGASRMAALSVETVGGPCRVNVSVATPSGAWAPVGYGTAAMGGRTVASLDTLVTVTPDGLDLAVVSNCPMLASPSYTPSPSDNVYVAEGSPAIFGHIFSVPVCTQPQGLSARSAEVVTPRTTTAIGVSGWDPSTVAVATVNLFAQKSAYTKNLVSKVLGGLLAIPNRQSQAFTFVISNVLVPANEFPINPVSDFWNNVRSKIANGLYSNGAGDKTMPTGYTVESDVIELQKRISLDLTNNYKPNQLNSIPVGVQTNMPSINNFLNGGPTSIQGYLNSAGSPVATQGYTITATQATEAWCIETLIYASPGASIPIITNIVKEQFMSYNATNTDLISVGAVFKGPNSFLVDTTLDMQPVVVMGSISAVLIILVGLLSFRGRLLKQHISFKLVRHS